MSPRARIAWGASVSTFALTALVAIAPPAPPSASALLQAYVAAHPQALQVGGHVSAADITRDAYSAKPGVQMLAESGTNYDWARIVLLSGGWPVTDSNVTVLVRWMRQENGPTNWWNRNNPLNNGYGSGGGAGLGSYPDLVTAAQMAAKNLATHSFYSSIVAGLAASAPPEMIEPAIWASPWASSHYGDGTHWSHAPVPVVKAPTSAWGD